MITVVIVNGANGSGKSTLARSLLKEFGGWNEYLLSETQTTVSIAKNGVPFLGTYKIPCGGLDTYKSWEEIENTILYLEKCGIQQVFAEGMVQYGVDRFIRLNSNPKINFVYICLSTDIRQCVKNVLKRRAEKGNEKEFNPKSVFAKDRGIYSLYNRLIEAGIEQAYRLSFEQAFECCKYYLTGGNYEHSN